MIHNLYKYTKATQYTFDAIKDNKIWFSRAKFLNDPFEFTFRMSKSSMVHFAARIFSSHKNTTLQYEFKRIMADKDELRRLKREFHNTVSDLQLRYVVLSLTKKWDSPTMWAHYSDEYRGVCIKYRLDNTQHWHQPLAVEVEGPKKYIGKITYTSKPIHCYDKMGNQLPGFATKALLRKHAEWSYEDEYRLIADDQNGNEKGVLKDLPDGSIAEVVFGHNVDEKFRTRLLDLLKEKRIPAYEVVLNKDSYKMKKKRI